MPDDRSSSLRKEIDQLIMNAYEVRVSDLSQSIRIANQALQKSIAIEDAGLQAKIKNLLSLFHFIRCDFEMSLMYANEAMSYYERTNDQSGIALAKYNIGSTYYRSDNFSQGLIYMLESSRIFEELGDHHNHARVLKSIGTVYEYFQDYTSAENAYQKCIEASQKSGDLNSESNAYNPLSGLYLKQGKIELAAAMIEKSLAMKKQTGDKRGLAFAIYGRGKVFIKQKKFSQAGKDFLESLAMHEESGDQLGLCMCCNKLGQLYIQMENYDQAKFFLHRALATAQMSKLTIMAVKSYFHLYLLSKKTTTNLEAFDYLEKYLQLKDRVISTETLHVIKSYQAKAKLEAAEAEARAQKEKREIIENKNTELDSFFYRVSHDLKGPIASLIGLHNLVIQEVTDPLSMQYFEMYQSQISRINRIVMGLIGLTQMKHLQDLRVKIDFPSLVEECINSYSYFDNFKNIKFIKEIELNIEYYSEWAIINTILQNLIENSIKYSQKENPYIKISIKNEGTVIRIAVEDNGQGIDEAHQIKIFDMFYRASERTKGSSGLGLYILKRAVERLRGTIELKSKLYEGSTFTVILPI
ncbi:MAG: tetratricopeptide repeat-containing sensor histidine kinase [Bacteroidetes bacterium]|nr:tetratricopeptide repeat-containing sensor histidine kinase [Bacteroidota bacterium]